MTLTVAVRTMKNEDSPPPDYDLLQSPNSHYENTKVSSRAKTIPHPTVIKSLSEAYKQILNCSFYYAFFDLSNSKVLEDQRSGTFLLRPSSHPHYLYTISVNKKGRVMNIRIRLTDQGLFSLEDGGQTTKAPDFTTIGNLVCYYMHKHAKAYYEDADAFRLLYPYRKRVVSLQTLAGEEIIRNTQRSQLGNLFIMKNFGSIHSIL
ncbi:unnamed protein product [Dimorphilus gyrociliatus]|uniref:SH2 domain-containing protein n=1 Tax=Dimorphilus gyrociliatus TaxID=2664684 RepID=A0A7I8VGM9_9ANNE|nr:unnamed protein product [Dimorphilus gyrociliatus]